MALGSRCPADDTRQKVRLVIEAECSSCGSVCDREIDGFKAVQAALVHTSVTGHIVILNGTADLPECDDPTI